MGVREELHQALDLEDFPSASLLPQVMARIDRPHHVRGYTRLASITAAAIAVALIATLIAVRVNSVPSTALPSAATINNLVEYSYASTQVGWIHLYSGGDIIARTTDGGRTWRRVLKVGGLLTGANLQAVDGQTAELTGYNHSGGVVWKTTDGGSHWQKQLVPTSEPFLITGATGYFIDSSHGWLLFQRVNCGGLMACAEIVPIGSLVYRTVDGGDHWNPVGVIDDLLAQNVRAHFVDQEVGVAVGGWVVAVTHDGGVTWKATTAGIASPACGIAIPPGCPTFAYTVAATLFDDQHGVFMVTGYDAARGYAMVSRTVYATFDGGVTWNEDHADRVFEGVIIFLGFGTFLDVAPASLPPQPGWYLATAHFVDVNHGWVTLTTSPGQAALGVDYHGDLYEMLATEDGGRTWHSVRLPQV